MKPIRLAAVSYLNTKPFIYGLYKSLPANAFDLRLAIPSECARLLKAGEADVVLTPVGALPDFDKAYVVSDYCIGSVGKVKTVCLYAERPLQQIRKVLLDFHSRTSVELIQILFREFWQQEVEFLPAQPGFESQIAGDTAALIIGDRTIGLEKQYPFVTDLGEAWTNWTGLPFVYASWISQKPMEPDFLEQFNEALQTGIAHLPELTKILPSIDGFDLNAYFSDNISYELDQAKWNGLNLFLEKLGPARRVSLYRNQVLEKPTPG
jgi:chorismate dehydratase